MSLLDILMPELVPEPIGARRVNLLSGEFTAEQRRKARYEYVKKWRAKNREKRNELDREWRRKRKA